MLFLDADRMEHARRALAGHPAVDRLRDDAEGALDRPAISVMDKTLLPPSGDPHDYLSLGPYWWPDPTQPDGRPYIRRDGIVNPEVEQADRPGLEGLAHDVQTLALAWFYLRDERFAARAAHRLRVWFLDPATRMNPHLEYGQAIPGVCDGRGIGIIDTAKLCVLPDALELLRSSDALSPAEEDAIRDWLREYLRWLQTSAHGITEAREHNNHGTWYDAQIATFATATDQWDAALPVLAAAAEKRFAPHIAPDGSQPHELARTRSLTYSCFNLTGFFDLAALGAQRGLDLWNWRGNDGRSLRGAVTFLAPYADENVTWPHEEIGTDAQTRLRPLLRRAALAYGDASFEDALRCSSEYAVGRFQLLWPQS